MFNNDKKTSFDRNKFIKKNNFYSLLFTYHFFACCLEIKKRGRGRPKKIRSTLDANEVFVALNYYYNEFCSKAFVFKEERNYFLANSFSLNEGWYETDPDLTEAIPTLNGFCELNGFSYKPNILKNKLFFFYFITFYFLVEKKKNPFYEEEVNLNIDRINEGILYIENIEFNPENIQYMFKTPKTKKLLSTEEALHPIDNLLLIDEEVRPTSVWGVLLKDFQQELSLVVSEISDPVFIAKFDNENCYDHYPLYEYFSIINKNNPDDKEVFLFLQEIINEGKYYGFPY